MSIVVAVLIWAGFAVAQALIGGTRLLFGLPAFAILGLAAVLAVFGWRKRRRIRVDQFCVLAALVFAGIIVGRAWWSPVVYLARPDLLLAVAALATYLLSSFVVTDPKVRVWLSVGILGLSLVQMAVGAVQFARGDNFMLFQWEGTLLDFIRSSDYTGRASGLYICPNHLAGNLEVVGVMILSVAAWGRFRVWVKLLLGYCAIGCLAGLILTGSRGGFLSVGVALLVFASLSIARVRAAAPERFKAILFATLAGILALSAGLFVLVKESAQLQRRANAFLTAKTQDVRPRLWGAAWRQFQLSPLTGTGSGTYLYYGRLLRDPGVQQDPEHAHNDYLELLAEYGILGGAALLLFLGAHLRGGLRDFRALRTTALWGANDRTAISPGRSNAAALNIGALAALAGILTHSVVDFNLHIPANALLLAWICGLLANPGRELAPAERLTHRFPRALIGVAPRVCLPGLGIGLLWATWTLLPGEYHAESARVALREEDYIAAVNAARDGLAVTDSDPNLFYYLGEAKLIQGSKAENPVVAHAFYRDAIDAFRNARELFPQETRINLRLGLALDVTGAFAEAEAAYLAALQWDPNSGAVWAYYGTHLQRQGLLTPARSAFEQAVRLANVAVAHQALQQLGTAEPAGTPPSN